MHVCVFELQMKRNLRDGGALSEMMASYLLHVIPALDAIAKATQSISKIHINVLKGQPQPAWSAPAE